MALSDFKVFSSYVQGSMTELLAEQTELFNAASNGAIVLRAAPRDGDYHDETYFAKLSGLVRRRNAYGSGSVTAVDLGQLSDTSVKVAAGTPPVNIDPGMFRWIQKNPAEAGVVYGTQLAKDRLADMLEVAIGSFVAAVESEGSNYLDSTAGSASLSVLNKAAAKLGDQSSKIAAWVMHSTAMHDLYGTAITNTERLFQFGNVQVAQDGFGRPLVMSDNDSLIVADGGGAGVDHFPICGVVSAGILVDDNGDYTENIQTSNGTENISRTIQSEWSYNAGIKGFAWDKTNGGSSPTTAALTTGSNWDKQATDSKNLAGVVTKVIAAS